MTARKMTAAAILVLWLGAVGWYAARLYLQPEAERVARAARTLPPGVAYYAAYRADRQVGWARSRLDTLPAASGFILSDLLEVDASGPGPTGDVRLEAETRLGPSLDLDRFRITTRGLLGGVSARGMVSGDSLLEITVAGPTDTTRRTLPLEGGVVPATALPLRLAAAGLPEVGDRIGVPSFDPLGMRPTTVEIEVLERSIRSYPDSAVRDPGTGDWRTARRDTVLAWRVARDVSGLTVEAWVDEDGRILDARVGDELRLERTAFELAYFGRPGVAAGEDADEARGGGE
ncbi:MAG: hypothetical protein ACOC83_04635 [Gemmatimonadota bacterium]